MNSLYNHLTLDELCCLILAEPWNDDAYREWFKRTKHVTAQQAKEAARAAS